MPGVLILGLDADTRQEVYDALDAAVASATHDALGCPEEWVTVFPMINPSRTPRKVIWVLAFTGDPETKPFAKAEEGMKQLSASLCPIIHQTLGFGADRKVEAFPVGLALHLHSIFPQSKPQPPSKHNA